MAVFWITVIVWIIFLIRWLVQSTGAGGQGGRSEESALEILKKRYARGEIDKKEFEARKKDLIYLLNRILIELVRQLPTWGRSLRGERKDLFLRGGHNGRS